LKEAPETKHRCLPGENCCSRLLDMKRISSLGLSLSVDPQAGNPHRCSSLASDRGNAKPSSRSRFSDVIIEPLSERSNVEQLSKLRERFSKDWRDSESESSSSNENTPRRTSNAWNVDAAGTPAVDIEEPRNDISVLEDKLNERSNFFKIYRRMRRHDDEARSPNNNNGQEGDTRGNRSEVFLEEAMGQTRLPVPVLINSNSAPGTLNLSYYGIGDTLTAAVAKSVQDNIDVTKLDLRENRLTEAAIESLSTTLSSPQCRVHTLDLSANRAGWKGLHALSRPLTNNCTLTTLILKDNQLGAGEMRMLTDALGHNSVLTHLDLSKNDIEEKGAWSLSKALTHNRSLKTLNLSWNQIRNKGAVFVAKAIGTNDCLETLNLAWNGFSDRDGVHFGVSLHANSTLRTLDLSHNWLREQSACVIGYAMRTNTALSTLVLDNNPLGRDGARSLVSSMDYCCTHNIHHTITLNGCDLQCVHQELADIQDPTGHHIYELVNPYDRMTAHEVVSKVHNASPNASVKNARLNKRSITIPVDGSWTPPQAGHLEFDVHLWRTRPAVACSDRTVGALVQAVKDAVSAVNVAIAAAHTLFFRVDHILHILERCRSSHADDLRQVEVLGAMFHRIVDFENRGKLLSFLSDIQRSALKRNLGQLYYFTPSNPSGHWRLALHLSSERHIALTIQEIGNRERRDRQHLSDTSRTGNAENWRNERLDGAAFTYKGSKPLPPTGYLEFDYVCTTRPPPTAEAMPQSALNRLITDMATVEVEEYDVMYAERMSAHTAGLCEDARRRPGYDTDPSSPPILLQVDYASRSLSHTNPLKRRPSQMGGPTTRPSISLPLPVPEDSCLRVFWERIKADTEFMKTAAARLRVLRTETAYRFLTAQQARQLLDHFPNPLHQIEAAVILFSRIIDGESFWREVLCTLPKYARPVLYRRLGILNVLNAMELEGYYELDMSVREDNLVARMLVLLASKEPGENWTGETFNGAGFEVPSAWLKEPPRRGFVTLTYLSIPGRTLLSMRREMVQKTLFGTRVTTQIDILKDPTRPTTAASSSANSSSGSGSSIKWRPTRSNSLAVDSLAASATSVSRPRSSAGALPRSQSKTKR